VVLLKTQVVTDVPQQQNVTFQGMSRSSRMSNSRDMPQPQNVTFQGTCRSSGMSNSRGYAATAECHIPGDVSQQQNVTFHVPFSANTLKIDSFAIILTSQKTSVPLERDATCPRSPRQLLSVS
jgi:hypothetical protein